MMIVTQDSGNSYLICSESPFCKCGVRSISPLTWKYLLVTCHWSHNPSSCQCMGLQPSCHLDMLKSLSNDSFRLLWTQEGETQSNILLLDLLSYPIQKSSLVLLFPPWHCCYLWLFDHNESSYSSTDSLRNKKRKNCAGLVSSPITGNKFFLRLIPRLEHPPKMWVMEIVAISPHEFSSHSRLGQTPQS